MSSIPPPDNRHSGGIPSPSEQPKVKAQGKTWSLGNPFTRFFRFITNIWQKAFGGEKTSPTATKSTEIQASTEVPDKRASQATQAAAERTLSATPKELSFESELPDLDDVDEGNLHGTQLPTTPTASSAADERKKQVDEATARLQGKGNSSSFGQVEDALIKRGEKLKEAETNFEGFAKRSKDFAEQAAESSPSTSSLDRAIGGFGKALQRKIARPLTKDELVKADQLTQKDAKQLATLDKQASGMTDKNKADFYRTRADDFITDMEVIAGKNKDSQWYDLTKQAVFEKWSSGKNARPEDVRKIAKQARRAKYCLEQIPEKERFKSLYAQNLAKVNAVLQAITDAGQAMK